MDRPVKVRFAPSPTGYLHIGGVRTALFNWLFARHHKGTFLLRIEDTDQSRSTDESIREILESMLWLGLDWDEGPYRQTQRQEFYRQKAEHLFKEGKAYNCYCSPEEVEVRKKEMSAKGLKPKYDGRCRNRTDRPEGVPHVLRFKTPEGGTITVEDMLRGKIEFDVQELDDLIIQRSDGSPTYNFAVVVDDADMGITHVIRGDDHLSNTPRQALLYDGLELPRPKFAHISMILGEDKTRLSKRHGATSALAYREMGYLPEALINYLVRLGWSYRDQEVFSRDEMIKKFSLASITTSAAVFNLGKLQWLNQHYIKSLASEILAEHWRPILDKKGLLDEKYDQLLETMEENKNRNEIILPPGKLTQRNIAMVIPALQERSKTLVEMAEKAEFYFKDEVKFNEKAKKNFLTPEIKPLLEEISEKLAELKEFEGKEPELETILKAIAEKNDLKFGKLAQPLRVALTGGTTSPGIYETLVLVGKKRTLDRLNAALTVIDEC